MTQYYKFFYPSACLKMPTFLHLWHASVSQYPGPSCIHWETRAEKRKYLTQNMPSCDLSRAKTNISYLLEYTSSSFGAVFENSLPYCFLCSLGILAGPSRKSKVLRNDCRSSVGVLLWQK